MEAKCKKCRFAARCLPLGRRAFVIDLAKPEFQVRGAKGAPMVEAMVDAVDNAICNLGVNPSLDALATLKNELGRYGLADTVEIVLEEQ